MGAKFSLLKSHNMDIETYLQSRKTQVDQALAVYLSSRSDWPPRLKEAIGYSLKAGGKRIRPILVLASLEACGGSEEEALPVALSLELIHTFSLIHDDLPAMDNDDLRRGKPTNHKIFGEGIAILTGDGLLSEAFYLLSQGTKNLEVIQDVALATGPTGMVGGQVLDLEGEGIALELEGLEKIHRYKTGRLITVSVTSGAKLAKAGVKELEAITTYGEKIGLAFQIADDILNVEGSMENLGKSVGSDSNKKKSTYPALIGLEASKRKAKELSEEAVEALNFFDAKADPLRAMAKFIIARKS